MMVVKQQWWWVLDPHIIALLSETESNEQSALVFGAVLGHLEEIAAWNLR